MTKPKLLVFSSTEGLPIARAIKAELDFDMDVTLWNQGVFELSQYNLESLFEKMNDADFASFIFLPEDIISIRNEDTKSVRDNVVFELGLFLGKLGRERVSFAIPKDTVFHLPTDLTGMIPGIFDYPHENLQASVGTYCNQIRSQVEKLKIRIPKNGKFGTNVLSKDVSKIHQTSSFTAIVPRGKKVTVRIQKSNGCMYGFDVYAVKEWILGHEKDNGNIKYITAIGPCEADACFRIMQGGNISIDVYEGDEEKLLFSKSVNLNKTK